MVFHPPVRRRIVGVSLKMHMDLAQTATYMRDVSALSELAERHNIDLFVVPDFVSLLPSRDILAGTSIHLGAQDTHWEDSGDYTAEASPLVLSQAGVQVVTVGRAERRRRFHETDDDVARKAAAVVRHGMVPVVCVGERTTGPVASQAVGLAVDECKVQVQAVLRAIPDAADVVFVYEPFWAVGSAESPEADHIVTVTKELRRLVGERHGRVRIVYGGSAGPGSFLSLKDGVDGLLLDRFGHDVSNLHQVILEMSL